MREPTTILDTCPMHQRWAPRNRQIRVWVLHEFQLPRVTHGRARLEPTCGGKDLETSNFNIGATNVINSRDGAVFMHMAVQRLRHLKINNNKRVKRS